MENIETKNLEKVITMARQIVTMKRDNAEWERDVLSDSEKKVLQEKINFLFSSQKENDYN